MQQTHTFTPPATAASHDAASAIDRTDVFEEAMTVLRNAGVGFVVLDGAEPLEQAA